MFGGNFLPLPVHAGRAFVIDLHAVHADIALPCFRIARDHAGQRDEASSIFRPALQDGKIEQREIVALDDFFAGAGGNRLRKELSHLGQHGQHLHFVEEALRRFHVHEAANALGDFVERIHFERQPHAARGAELVDQQLRAGIAFDVFEQQSFPADSSPARSRLFETRSAISVISRIGSTSVRMRFSSPARSSALIQSRRSS